MQFGVIMAVCCFIADGVVVHYARIIIIYLIKTTKHNHHFEVLVASLNTQELQEKSLLSEEDNQ